MSEFLLNYLVIAGCVLLIYVIIIAEINKRKKEIEVNQKNEQPKEKLKIRIRNVRKKDRQMLADLGRKK